ncbi:MFS general substrate transporter [Aspergillus brunneoviolaceus CBS 621.78]|uniref:MFS general substrate transporter n=1 Tax=Aspergillus brunneoviolaceus CBS 621.78 TaxID=1450534 RepID=A0ACD1GHR7_9EURO|nr:MFS general substrate transporter [Aspergillus brunneoviolaceus CBS 621.78]RAH48785.1 MFS general substrate transporter [Aspergillus brunneoviolaceus CBS 621.78]
MQAHNTSSRGIRLAILVLVCLVILIDTANVGMANIALPTIKEALGYNEGDLQRILTAYSLTFGGFLMTSGRLGDIFGHRMILLLGMTLLGLIIGRAFQGLAAAFTIPSAQSLVALAFENPKARVRAFGAWGACGSSGFVFGPILGGVFTSLVTWKWWKDQLATLHTRLDLPGTLLSVAGLILLIYALTTGNIDGWNQANVLTTLILAVVALGVFLVLELRFSADPILPRYMITDRGKALGCASAALTYAVWQGSNYLLTLQLQSFGYSALATSLRFIPLGVTALVVNFVVPLLIGPVGARTLLVCSWTLTLGGLVLFTRMGGADDYWRFCLPGMVLYIAGVGTVYFVGNVSVVATAKKEQQGTVAGVYNMFLNVGGAVLGVAVLTVISNSVTANHGGEENPRAALNGYRAGHYAAIAMAALRVVLSLFFRLPCLYAPGQQPPTNLVTSTLKTPHTPQTSTAPPSAPRRLFGA